MRAQQPPGLDSAVVGFVRQAHALGVDLMDLSTGPDPDGNRAVLVQALGEGASSVTTLVRAPDPVPSTRLRAGMHNTSTRPPPPGPGRGGSVSDAEKAIPLVPLHAFATISGDGRDAADDAPPPEFARPTRPWGIDIPRGSLDPRPGRAAVRQGASVFHLEASLLDLATLEVAQPSASEGGVSIVVANPHAGGLLDGGWLRAGPFDRHQVSEPLDARAMEQRLQPVTRLGFLTEGRRRILAVAAVQLLLDRPSVASVVVAPGTPKDLDALARPESWSPLTDDELRAFDRWRAYPRGRDV
ncbi:MAG: hypothetical protein L3K15_05210 [Thermoplasmata archaeon]|nr:hypothetical protein [Thermoplasmata archaeon]